MPALDGARALAIVLVVLSHISVGFLYGGGLGVDLFFVLSGYLITGILYREFRRTGQVDLRRFYLRRFARLYPELIAVIAVFAPIGFWLATSRTNFMIETLHALTYSIVVPFEITAWPGLRFWSHLWTLSIEELFYLVWPGLMLAMVTVLRSRAALLTAVAGLLALVASSVLTWLGDDYPSVFFRVGAMALGAALALAPTPQMVRSPLTGWLGLSLFLASVALSSMPTAAPIGATFLPAAVGSTLLVAHISQGHGALTRLLASRPLVYLGGISYSWYLWHFPLAVAVTTLVENPWIAAGIWVPASALLAAVSHRLLTPIVSRLKGSIPSFERSRAGWPFSRRPRSRAQSN